MNYVQRGNLLHHVYRVNFRVVYGTVRRLLILLVSFVIVLTSYRGRSCPFIIIISTRSTIIMTVMNSTILE